jgi:putative Holliday junction resolvase
MGRIMALDIGRKRIGVAVSDPAGIIAQGLTTVAAHELWDFLKDYLGKEEVSEFVVGYPVTLRNEPSEALRWINPVIKKLKKSYPEKKITQVDERFTSALAQQAILTGGVKKEKRRDKALVDKVSATIILQSYMEQRKNIVR